MRSHEKRAHGRIVGRGLLLALTVVLLASCRLVISTDGTGHILSASGSHDCNQNVCPIGITELFSETFTAVAAEGYRFVGWDGICSFSPTSSCELALIPLPAEYQEYDGDVALSAIFESSSAKRAWYRDKDGDNYGAPNKSKMAFEQPDGFVINKLDCDDRNSRVRPRAKEKEDGLDNNCNGRIDEGFAAREFFIDRDGDGFGDATVSTMEVRRPAGYVDNSLDCNDYNTGDNPDADEVADERDNDCDGSIDEGLGRNYPDVDGDGFGATTGYIDSIEPIEGYVNDNSDCDDVNSAIYPGAEELLDSVDNDCDGVVDEGFALEEYFRDVDGDGFGDSQDSVFEVEMPEGYAARGSDNCVSISNAGQNDIDRDGIGDACDDFTDTDRDGLQDSEDNCPNRSNRSQSDSDGDGIGDTCDSVNGLDLDRDGVNDDRDNCPANYNPNQSDIDSDGQGDFCDATDDRDTGGGDGGDTPPGDNLCEMSAEDLEMLNAVNAFRSQPRQCGTASKAAAPSLTWSCPLKKAALAHSMDMANNNYFDHYSQDGRDPGDRISAQGYSWSTYGENIAAGNSSVGGTMSQWINSPGHCNNLMNPSFRNLGAAKFSNPSSTYRVYWTQNLGTSR